MIRQQRAHLTRIFGNVLGSVLLASTCGPLIVAACSSDPPAPGKTANDANASADTAMVDAHSADAGADTAVDPCAPEPIAQSVDAGDGGDGSVDRCAALVRLKCGISKGVVPRDNCFFALNDCSQMCDGLFFNCHTTEDSCLDGSVPETGPITVDCVICPGAVGRRPEGLRSGVRQLCGGTSQPSFVGQYLAEAGHLEAASVYAFYTLRRELHAFGAPRELVRAAARARRDEIRHTRVTARLAQRFGAKTPRPTVRRNPRRPLLALAIENAVEGCVRETFGALLATWQATHAQDPRVAQAFARIAKDETDHAALAIAVAQWADTQLDADARAAVAHARDGAITTLMNELGQEPHPTLVVAAGVPTQAEQRRLLTTLADALWA